MNTNDAVEPLTQVFSRFFISGLVFYLFVIWLPLYAYLKVDINGLMQGPFFVVLFSIMLGLLLDLSKSYRLFGPRPYRTRTELRSVIVRAFGIHIDDSIKSKSYLAKIGDVSRQIHDIYIRTNHPELDKRILDSRIYPNILGITLLSVTLFILIGIVFLMLLVITKFLRPLTFLELCNQCSFTPFRITSLVLLNVVALYVLIRGKTTTKIVFKKTTELTSSIIAKGYCDAQKNKRDEFIESLPVELISDVNGNKRWQIKECE